MKIEELTAIGLSEELAKKVTEMHGKEVDKHLRKIGNLEEELNSTKSQLDTANTTLKKFEGLDPEKIQSELEGYKTQAENAKRELESKLTQRDQKDWIEKQLDEYGVKSPYARRQLVSDCMSEDSGLKWKDGAFFGFDDFMKSAKEKDSALYLSAEEKAAAEKNAAKKKDAPKFSDPIGNPDGGTDTNSAPPKIF